MPSQEGSDPMSIADILASVRWQDIVDIAIVSVLIYWIIILIKGTRAVQMIFGLALIIVAFFISRKGELLTLRWILNTFWSSIIVVIIVIFQHDIRRALTTFGKNPFFTGSRGIPCLRGIDNGVGLLSWQENRGPHRPGKKNRSRGIY
jgi:DNA integrity scanning protein DisA with diadenylate cyclase activity